MSKTRGLGTQIHIYIYIYIYICTQTLYCKTKYDIINRSRSPVVQKMLLATKCYLCRTRHKFQAAMRAVSPIIYRKLQTVLLPKFQDSLCPKKHGGAVLTGASYLRPPYTTFTRYSVKAKFTRYASMISLTYHPPTHPPTRPRARPLRCNAS